MVIALLAILGVNLIVIVIFLVFVVGRKRWVKRQSGVFIGEIRVTSGDVDGFKPKWMRGYGRWVRDVLVWTKAPFLFRNELVPIDSVGEHRAAVAGETKRLGADPVIVVLRSGAATIEVAVHRDDLGRVIAPFPNSALR